MIGRFFLSLYVGRMTEYFSAIGEDERMNQYRCRREHFWILTCAFGICRRHINDVGHATSTKVYGLCCLDQYGDDISISMPGKSPSCGEHDDPVGLFTLWADPGHVQSSQDFRDDRPLSHSGHREGSLHCYSVESINFSSEAEVIEGRETRQRINMPKASSLAGVKKARHTPLHVDLNEDAELSKFGRISSKAVKKQQQRDKKANADGGRDGLEGGLRGGRAAAAGGGSEVGQGRVETARMSRKILDLARKQQDEIEAEMDGEDDEDANVMRITGAVPRKEDLKSTRQAMEDDEEEEDSDFPDEDIEEEEYAELVSRMASCRQSPLITSHLSRR